MLHSPVQSRRAIGFWCVDVDTLGDQRERRFAIAGFHGLNERRGGSEERRGFSRA